MQFFRNLRLNAKISLLGVVSVLLTAVTLVILAVWLSGQYNTLAQKEVDSLIDADLDHITQGVYNLVQTENEAVQQQLDSYMHIARHILAQAGGISLSKEKVSWEAVNQFTNISEKVWLPGILIGSQLMNQSRDMSRKTAVVDEITNLVGESATIFQRMNEKGDMLRVATTVQNTQGERAIGTCIPAANPDGRPNPVISAIMQRKPYHGRAYVVNNWYLTVYVPITDKSGEIVGMLYVGTRQKSVESRIRQAVLQIMVGRTGYVYVLDGTGEERGCYIISQRGERDGEDIWESKDSDGRLVIQEIISKAITLKPGELATERYRWKNPGEKTPRWKIARLAYYAPWDWVIGTSVYEDELQSYRSVLSNGRVRMTRIMILSGLVISLIIGMLGVIVAWTITHPVRQITMAAETIIKGGTEFTVKVHANDEIGILTETFNIMTDRLTKTMEGLQMEQNLFMGGPTVVFKWRAAEGWPVEYVSPNVTAQFGYSPDDLTSGRVSYSSIVHPDELQRVVDEVTIFSEEKLPCFEQEYRITHKNGEYRWIHDFTIVVRNPQGIITHYHGYILDITDRKNAEEELYHLNTELEQRVAGRTAELLTANRELESFAYSLSHDLRAPLRCIDGFSQALLDDYEKNMDSQGRHYLHRMRMASQHMAQLIDDMLRLSRVIRSDLKRDNVSLSELASVKASDLQSGEPERQVEFVIVPDIIVNADHNMMRIVIENLLENAWKFTGKHDTARIELNMMEREGNPVYYVRDDGSGFDMAYAVRLFSPFQRLHKVEEFEGTGIGLATVHRIISRHGGHIWAESEVDKGATFYFTLS